MINTIDGVEQVGYLNPYDKVEAETMDDQSGIETSVSNEGGMRLTSLQDGDWIKIRGADFEGAITKSFTGSFASETSGSTMEVRLDNLDGEILGSIAVPNTGWVNSWQEETINIENNIEGVHDLYFIFKGNSDQELYDFDFWYFNELPLGVEDVEMATLYPNPSYSGEINISLDQAANVTILSLDGKKVFEDQLTRGVSTIQDRLIAGVYIVKFVSKDQAFTKKLIVK